MLEVSATTRRGIESIAFSKSPEKVSKRFALLPIIIQLGDRHALIKHMS
jgi:hypothetical protein